MNTPMSLVVIGLSLSSSWGNGHATTFRALLRGLREQGHRTLFLERDVPWYAENRDLDAPDFCSLEFYDDVADLELYRPAIRGADAVIVGSYVPDGVAVIDRVAAMRPQRFCFYDIDTPVTMARLDRGDEEYIARRQVPLFDSYFSFSGGEVLTGLMERFSARVAHPLHCSVDETRYFVTHEDVRWDLGYLGTYSEDRQPVLERLLFEPARRLPGQRFVVAGSGYPEGVGWPENVEHIAHLPPRDHISFYNRQRFTLNVTRADMVAAGWSPSVRLFEAAACGTPVISDRWRGLDEFFPEGEAIAVADTSDDVVRMLTELGEAERLAIARSARQRVLTSHTGQARARELVAALRTLRPTRPALTLVE